MKVPECYVCPITNELMEDPVVTVDGFSFERKAIVQWLRSSDLSPLTGQKLASTVLISNVNLHKAIEMYRKSKDVNSDRVSEVVSVFPRQATTDDHPYAYLEDTPDFLSSHLKGSCISVSGRVATRITEPMTWYQTVVFTARPVKIYGAANFFVIEVLDSVNEWSGLILGLSTVDFRQQESQTRVIDEYSYYLDAQGWLRAPDSSTTLCGWNAGTLRTGAVLTVTLPDDGRFVLSVDGKIKIDVLPELPIPNGPLFPFFACSGACKSARLLDP